ncbi:MAG: sodium:proton antiporter [Rhodobacteraceae bacterium PARR1]|nr:MAG: sodium:proton antiporter [Rhodobacteraceae bacterium PARR1]
MDSDCIPARWPCHGGSATPGGERISRPCDCAAAPIAQRSLPAIRRSPPMYRVSPFVRRFAWALLGGAGVATVWANVSPASYYDMIEWRFLDREMLTSLPFSQVLPDTFLLTHVTLVSDVLMALFLFFVGKELWEALVLERGALTGRQALLPAWAVAGGMLGAVLFWVLYIIIGYVIARAVFGAGHPALHLSLLVSIASSLAGLLLAGIADATFGLALLWLLLPLGATLWAWLAFGRPDPDAPERVRRRSLALWPWLLAGAASWIGVAAAGLPPALGLLPVIPAIPHADRAFGLFAEAEEFLHDPLNRLSHLLVKPLAVILFAFGLTRGGIDLGALAPTTGSVLAALWIGKPLGFLAGALLAALLFRLDLPRGVRLSDLLLVAMISGVGFTLPVLALDSALPGGAMAEAARMGAALSLLLGPMVIALARLRRPPPASRAKT